MGVELAIAGEFLCESVPVYAGDRVLDVGTASGNAALSAARRRAKVTAIDLVPSLLERARQRASAEGLAVDFQEGDAMALAFPDASFDVVLSTFGAIFAPDPDQTAAEMARVCRPGGKVALAAWTPDGMLGRLFQLLARYAPAELVLDAPNEWGEEAKFRKRLGPYSNEIAVQTTSRTFSRDLGATLGRGHEDLLRPGDPSVQLINSNGTENARGKDGRPDLGV
jgi:ubiquinone/menaquinone biosynthesis C-methylase UbiE